MKLRNLVAGVAMAGALIASAPAVALGQTAAETQVTVPPATLLSYAGTYKTDRGMDAVIAAGLDGSLTIEINGPPLRMRPVSLTEFAVDEKRARVTFHGETGKVSGFTVRMGQRELHATRVN